MIKHDSFDIWYDFCLAFIMKRKISILLLALILVGCEQVQKVSDVITNPSAREVFERNLKEVDSLFKIYEARYTKTKNNNLELDLPAVISSKSDSVYGPILAYNIKLKRGERLKIQSSILADSLQLVMDVYAVKQDFTVIEKALVSNRPGQNYLEMGITEYGTYKIVIFPYKKPASYFDIRVYTEPTFDFPVSGKGNSAIQSFWGAPRAGGKRTHKGIDIFAKRGTPVIAVTNGFISNTGNRGLGGKQVWLRDGVFGQSLYYAHLDSILVKRGTRVNLGDTLGLVGNTGNARTTSPHLHFGIYTSSGAINPLPFVKKREILEFTKEAIFSRGRTKLQTNQLRLGPSVRKSKILSLNKNMNVEAKAKVNDWYHIKLADSIEGFMHKTLITFTK